MSMMAKSRYSSLVDTLCLRRPEPSTGTRAQWRTGRTVQKSSPCSKILFSYRPQEPVMPSSLRCPFSPQFPKPRCCLLRPSRTNTAFHPLWRLRPWSRLGLSPTSPSDRAIITGIPHPQQTLKRRYPARGNATRPISTASPPPRTTRKIPALRKVVPQQPGAPLELSEH